MIEAPRTALAEVLYSVSRDKDVRGVTLTGPPERAREALVETGPVSVAPIADEELASYARLVGEFSIHDGLIVASHRTRGTDAVATSDGAVRDAGVETVWE